MNENFDVLIIGAGLAGLYLAASLGQKNKVLLLESGGVEHSEEAQLLSNGHVETSYEDNYFSHSPPENYRYRGLGGAGNLWGGACCRFTLSETNSWLSNGLDLTKFYDSVQKNLEVKYSAGFHDTKNLFSEIDYLENFQTDTLFVLNNPTTLHERISKRLLSDNVKMKFNNTVVKLEVNDEMVNQVKCYDHKKKLFYHINNFKKIIVTCGGLESARLLMYSFQGTKHYNKNLGRYYSPHLNFYLPIAIFNTLVSLRPFNTENGGEIEARNYITLREKNHKRLINFKCLIDPFWPNADLSNLQRLLGEDNSSQSGPLVRKLKRIFGQHENVYSLNFSFDQPKDFKSRIALTNELDFLGVPKLKIFHHISDEFIEGVKNTVDQLAVDMYSSRIARIPVNVDKKFLFENANGRSHHCGGIIIGDDREYACCDEDCGYFGIGNLDVISSALFPHPGGINPTLTILALADRLAKRYEHEA